MSKVEEIKAVALLSGGLDSTLAAQLILNQNVKVFGFTVVTPFFGPERWGSKHSAVRQAADSLGLSLFEDEVFEEYLEILRNPQFGYGRALNPCIDCHIFFLRRAKAYMEELEAHFVITGEVVGQRPMSQTRHNLRLIEMKSELEKLIVRPLSAKLLPETIPEENGWIDREKLLGIEGRSRKDQIELAKELKVDNYPTPGGGCILTELGFASKVRDLLAHNEDTMDNIKLLKTGRHFRLPENASLIVGKNQEENMVLLDYLKNGGYYLEAPGGHSPITMLQSYPISEKDLKKAAKITAKYSKKVKGKPKPRGKAAKVKVTLFRMPGKRTVKDFLVSPMRNDECRKFLIG